MLPEYGTMNWNELPDLLRKTLMVDFMICEPEQTDNLFKFAPEGQIFEAGVAHVWNQGDPDSVKMKNDLVDYIFKFWDDKTPEDQERFTHPSGHPEEIVQMYCDYRSKRDESI